MKQACAACCGCVYSQFGSHNAGKVRHLNGVVEHILAIAGPIGETAKELDDFVMNAMNVRFQDRAFPFRFDFMFDFTAGFFHRFFDS